MDLYWKKWNFEELNKNPTKTSYKMQITKSKDTNPPITIYVHMWAGCFSSSVSNTSSATAVTVPMAYNPEARELAQSWAAQTFDHPWTKSFHGSKRFTEIAASREQGTWGKKQGSCSNKDFLLPGACWQLTQPCLCQNWMVSGDILDKTGFVSASVLCVSKSHSLVSFLCAHQERSSHTSTREGHLKTTKMDLDKYLGLMQAKPKSGFCLNKCWKTAWRDGSVEEDRRSLLELHVPVFRWLSLFFWLYKQGRSILCHPTVRA